MTTAVSQGIATGSPTSAQLVRLPTAKPEIRTGWLAETYASTSLPVWVLRSAAGYYIGTFDHDGAVPRDGHVLL
ncbi:hypothetical protein C1H69_10385 [Billgrantia endophytica]|uniref:Uncharacterized protein n=1 Tax=Billgrantia endophytica TaxID=2033802 RepID=A0A2N7U4F8_9GAMM|nr:hypothetical protein C1H69_10385 [Halomonas endophytica]